MKKKSVIGLFGFGVVAQGLYDALQNIKSADISIKKIVVKSKDKIRSLDAKHFSFDPNDILNDPEINSVVELIDDAEAAYHIVKQALKNGKHVVSAGKKMLAEHLPELSELAQTNNVSLLYEASACGSIPIIRNLEEYYDNDLTESVAGILNGSSNYILSKIFNENKSYEQSLKEAQDKGFAESNPIFDVEGFDSLHKLIIITLHSFGLYISPSKVLNYGISKISAHDIAYAKEKGLKIKLVGQVFKVDNRSVTLFVLPRFVPPHKYIYNVEEHFNGVVIRGKFYDKQFMFGQGAGGHPTGSAVLSDITALSYNYKYEYKKQKFYEKFTYNPDKYIEIYLRYDSEKVLAYFHFETIKERFISDDFNYITGEIKISDLINLKEILPKLDVFIAYTGKEIG